MPPSTLLDPFRDALSAATRDALPPAHALSETLDGLVEVARAAWPEVELDDPLIARELAARIDGQDDPARALSELRVADLYVAWGCIAGDDRALTAFERELLPTITSALARLRIGPDAVEELTQGLREQLFVGAPPRGKPLLANYSGRGQLRNWLRIIAVRTAGKFLDKDRREVQMSESMLGDLGPASADPELEHLKRTYRGAFRRAFAEALASLDSRDRLFLGHTYVDRLTIDEIGAIYSVHRATAARRVARARDTLLERTRQMLMRQIKVDRHEYESIMRLIESQLPVSFSRLGVSTGAAAGSDDGADEA
jgi:RNA polymerase sigma-70 factor (ECF subfamily)